MTRYFFGTDGNMFVERRATPRYEVELDIEIRVVGSASPIHGRTKDISEAGMQLILPKAIREGRVIDFASPVFSGSAQTVWCRNEDTEVRLGMRFVSLSPKDYDALIAVISRLRKAASASALTAWE